MQKYIDQASVQKEQITPSLLAYIPEARNISSVLNDQQKIYDAKSFPLQSENNNNYQSSHEKINDKKMAGNDLPNTNSETRHKNYENEYYSVINSKDQPSVINKEQVTSTIYDTKKQFNYSKPYQQEDYDNKKSMIPLEKPNNLNYSKHSQKEQDFKHEQQNAKTKNFEFSNIYQSEKHPIRQEVPEKRKNSDYSSKLMSQNYQSSIAEKSKIENLQQNSKLNQNSKTYLEKSYIQPNISGIKPNLSNVINPPPKSQIFDYNTQKELDELIANRYYQEEMELQARMDEETARAFANQQEEGLTVSTINNIERIDREHQLAMDEYLAHEYKGFFFIIIFFFF